MKHKKYFEISENLLNKIISVAYGDANILDRYKVYRLASKYSEVKNLLNSYKKTAADVHKIGEDECPEELISLIESRTTKISGRADTFTADFFAVLFNRPIVSAAVTIIMIGFLTYGIIENRAPRYEYSRDEIELADQQARQALAIVGKIFEQTNTTLKEEVLNSRVAKPIRESVDIVNDLLSTKENKNGGIK
jgi:hypothetical protein